MYFQKFPLTFYTLDDRKSTQLITNFLLRVDFADELSNNYSTIDEYDIKEGETPEILAHKFYNDSNLHWILLHVNKVLNPNFEWVLSSNKLNKYVQSKYFDSNGIHHYEDAKGNIVNGVLRLTVGDNIGFQSGDVIINLNGKGTGVLRGTLGDPNADVLVTEGGFKSGNQFSKIYDSTTKATIVTATPLNVTPVTNYLYEEKENEKRRRIKVLKPQFIQTILKDFENKLSLTDV